MKTLAALNAGLIVIIATLIVSAVQPPMPPHASNVMTLSMQMRMAAQIARGKAAPWTQRFMVIAVEEKALTRNEDDGQPVFSTNYFVTVMPITDETNSPVTWGVARNKSLRFITTSPTKRGDEFELFPVKMPVMP